MVIGGTEIWYRSLDVDDNMLARLHACLSPGEREKASRYRGKTLQTWAIASRGHLREILGQCLGVAPSALEFGYTDKGKPYLVGGTSLKFNLSHSQEVALYAVNWDNELGIDIEKIQADFDYEEVLEAHFTASEKASLQAMPPDRRRLGFYQRWTRKEALLKGFGFGLSVEPNKVELPISGWVVEDLDAGPGVVAALAVRTG